MIYTVAEDGHLIPGRPKRALNAKAGPVKSVNAGVGASQIQQGDRDMALAGVDVKYDPATGNMHAADRRTFLKALKVRGLYSNTDNL